MAASTTNPGFLRRAYAWPRLRVMLLAVAALGSLLSLPWEGPRSVLFLRLVLLGMGLLAVFAVTEHWPRRLPRPIARWAFQIVLVAASVPFAAALVYALTTVGDPVPWVQDATRMAGYSMISGFSLLIAPWIVMVAVYRDISGRAERQALDFRLRLLQSQVEPHFLFNTLANIRELVVQGSAEAPAMLQHLIDYLRAAVPRLNESSTTIAEELELVRSYLDIMRMRMPDRLQYSVEAAPGTLGVACPPAALLVLVENAVRHGIDPGEAGGTISIRTRIADPETCEVEVTDTGVGLGAPGRGGTTIAGLGTGLGNLRERLRLLLGPQATLEVSASRPRGTRALLRLPLRGRDDA